jgi:hypothetical protein
MQLTGPAASPSSRFVNGLHDRALWQPVIRLRGWIEVERLFGLFCRCRFRRFVSRADALIFLSG